MALELNVPWVTQLQSGAEDPTGCWYASVRMIFRYFALGSHGTPLPRLHSRLLPNGRVGNWPTGSPEAIWANPHHHRDLARHEGLQSVRGCSSGHYYSARQIERLLTRQGPIFMYWWKRNGGPISRHVRTNQDGSYGHAAVIVGVNELGIVYHDPEFRQEVDGSYRIMSVADFNSTRQVFRWALMQRAGETPPSVARASEFWSTIRTLAA